MSKSINVALGANPSAAEVMDVLKDQLLIVLIERLGGEVVVPVSEIDEVPKDKMLGLEVVEDPSKLDKGFRFKVSRKQ
jgi:hypothetical protein